MPMFTTPSSTSDGIAAPQPDVRTEYLHSLPDQRSSVQISGCDDRLAPIGSSGSLLPASDSNLHPAVCKIALSPLLTYRHCRQYLTIQYLKTVYSKYLVQLKHGSGSIRWILLNNLCSTFHNPPWRLRCEYRCGKDGTGDSFLILGHCTGMQIFGVWSSP